MALAADPIGVDGAAQRPSEPGGDACLGCVQLPQWPCAELPRRRQVAMPRTDSAASAAPRRLDYSLPAQPRGVAGPDPG